MMKLSGRKPKRNRARLLLEVLESRRLMCITVGPDGQIIFDDGDVDGDVTHLEGSPAIIDPGIDSQGGGTGTTTGGTTDGAIPLLSSRPGAPANLYLNFGGDNVS